VIEASLGSGSLITANLALDQGREVFAVPGFPSDPRYKGNNKLLKQGAIMVESAADVLNNLPNLELKRNDSLSEQSSSHLAPSTSVKTISQKDRAEIISLLSNVPIEIELLARHSQIPLNVVYCIIIELELAGKIMRAPGNKISLNYQGALEFDF
jgi:DNA processing protein